MTPCPVESHAWSTRRLWVTIGLLVLFQTALVWWIGGRTSETPKPRKAPRLPQLVISLGPATDLPLATDPTLSARPNIHGFSGQAWMAFPPPDRPNVDWTEPERVLRPEAGQLGAGLLTFAQTNTLAESPFSRHSEPPLENTEFYAMLDLVRTQSSLRISGDLANRPLESELALKSFAPTDQSVLPNTELLVGVAPDGRVLSVVPLKQCKMKEADDEAVALALKARFRPLASQSDQAADLSPGMDLTWGRMIFQWRSLAPPPAKPTAGAL